MAIDKLKTKFFTGAWLTDVKHYFTKINEIIDYLNGVGTSGDGSYKVYTGTVTQTSTNAPVVTVLNNTLGNIVWTYIGDGAYIGTLPGGFPDVTKVFVYIQGISDFSGAVSVLYRDTTNTVIINTYSDNTAGTPANDLLINRSLEIRVYN